MGAQVGRVCAASILPGRPRMLTCQVGTSASAHTVSSLACPAQVRAAEGGA